MVFKWHIIATQTTRKRGENVKDLLRRLKHWYECDRPASIGYWILDMDADHRWFGPLVSVLSSLVG